MTTARDKYAAGEQGLGYIYQVRYALLYLMGLDEGYALQIEADDDVQVVDAAGKDTLVSLKHKQAGQTVGTLSIDFWKSVRIWLARYVKAGKLASDHAYCMVTTARVGPTSELRHFLAGSKQPAGFAQKLIQELDASKSPLIGEIKASFKALTSTEQDDFLARIVIADESPRINDLGAEVNKKLRFVRPAHRDAVRERLEGWWNAQAIELTTQGRQSISGLELTEKVASINDEYTSTNLPIEFIDRTPPSGVHATKDTRQFVEQLRAIGVKTEILEGAILDFYRAFEQRSSWARTQVLFGGEVAAFEKRLVSEWRRVKAHIEIEDENSEQNLQKAGRELYRWAELETNHLRIRDRVTEPYVTRGSFHMLADRSPDPGVYWHPKFLERLKLTLEVTE